jgi:hypothetical protein
MDFGPIVAGSQYFLRRVAVAFDYGASSHVPLENIRIAKLITLDSLKTNESLACSIYAICGLPLSSVL